MPARTNRGIVTTRDVKRTALLRSDWESTFPRRQIHTKIEELCFLCGPCRGVIKWTKKIVWISWVSRRQPAWIWAWKQRIWTEILIHQNYWVQFSEVERLAVNRGLYVCYSSAIFGVCIQWECYSSWVKIRSRKRIVEIVIDWGH
jgi:hypothetical protein